MGTKLEPGQFDCYHAALPDEPMFVLLARDPAFFDLVSNWAAGRAVAIRNGYAPESDWALVNEALKVASDGADWRRANNGSWRNVSGQ